jgi:hypothetical protein
MTVPKLAQFISPRTTINESDLSRAKIAADTRSQRGIDGSWSPREQCRRQRLKFRALLALSLASAVSGKQ